MGWLSVLASLCNNRERDNCFTVLVVVDNLILMPDPGEPDPEELAPLLHIVGLA